MSNQRNDKLSQLSGVIRRFIPSPDKKKGLPGTNEMENWARTNRYGAAKHRKAWKKHVVNSISPCPRFNRIWLEIIYYEPNKRRDKDNIAGAKKYILDGLVDAGIIEKDGWDYIVGWAEFFEIDKDNPGIEIWISEDQ